MADCIWGFFTSGALQRSSVEFIVHFYTRVDSHCICDTRARKKDLRKLKENGAVEKEKVPSKKMD